MPIITGQSLKLQSATLIGDSTVRVRFTQEPLAVNSAGTTDALNPNNWSLSGPNTVVVTGVAKVFGDLQSLDLICNLPLNSGSWTVTVNDAVVDIDSQPVQAPKTVSFTVSVFQPTDSSSQGAFTESQYSVLRKFLNPALKGPNWNAVLNALAASDQINIENAHAAFNQLYLSSASGIFLNQRAADQGIVRPVNLGLNDDDFRNLALVLANKQLTLNAILDILQQFYGVDALHAKISSINEPFDIADQDTLTILFDGAVTHTVIFDITDFSDPTNSTALEVSAAVNRSLRAADLTAWAQVIEDSQTGIKKVEIYSGSLGLNSTISITGGTAQPKLQFPTKLNVYTGTPIWNISVDLATSEIIVTTTDVGTIQLWKIQPGDYAVITGQDFDILNRGTFFVSDVTEDYTSGYMGVIKLLNNQGVNQASVGTYGEAGMMFFRPLVKNIQAEQGRTVVVAQLGNQVDINIPVTSLAVKRQVGTAAYLQPTVDVNLTSIKRLADGSVTLTVDSTSDLLVGDNILVKNSVVELGKPTIVEAPEVVIDDRFNRPDQTYLGATPQGPVWSNTFLTTGHFDIVSDKANATTLGSGSASNIVDSGASNVFIEATLDFYSDNVGLLARVLDSNNFIFLDFSIASFAWTVYVRIAGTFIPVISGLTDLPSPGDVIGLAVADGTVRYLLNGNTIGSGALPPSASVIENATQCGILAEDVGDAFSRFIVVKIDPNDTTIYTANLTAFSAATICSPLTGVPSTTGTRYHQAFLYPDGRVGVLGGESFNGIIATDVQDLDVFQIINSTTEADNAMRYQYEWVADAVMPAARKHFTATSLPNSHRVFVYGGMNNSGGPYPDAWLFIPGAPDVDGVWFDTTAGIDRAGHQASLVGTQEHVLVTGGISTSGAAVGDVAEFNPINQTWTTKASLNQARAQHAQITLSDGRILVVGGRNISSLQTLDYINNTDVLPVLASAEVYDPNLDEWDSAGNMTYARFGAGVIQLPDNRVFIIGGVGYIPTQSTTPEPLATVEVWDPETNSFSAGPSMTTGRDFPVVAYSAEFNRIYASGGPEDTSLEYLDLNEMVWKPSLGEFPFARRYSVGVTLPNGTILNTGGMQGTETNDRNVLIVPAAEQISVGNFNTEFKITDIPNSTTLRSVSNDTNWSTSVGGTITRVRGESGAFAGPFVLNPQSGVGVSGVSAVIAMDIGTEGYYALDLDTTLDSTPAFKFPNEPGWLIFDFGGAQETAPVPYLGWLTSTQLRLDPDYIFLKPISSGVKIHWLVQKGPWSPSAPPPSVGPFYVTDSPAGHAEAVTAIEGNTATGQNINIKLIYPSDRGLGGEGYPVSGPGKLSDIVGDFADGNVDLTLFKIRQGEE